MCPSISIFNSYISHKVSDISASHSTSLITSLPLTSATDNAEALDEHGTYAGQLYIREHALDFKWMGKEGEIREGRRAKRPPYVTEGRIST